MTVTPRSMLLLLAAMTLLNGAALAEMVKVGEGAYSTVPKGGDQAPPLAPFRTPEMLAKAAPTNQWYSSLIFQAKPEVIYAQPLSFLAQPAGLEMALPTKEVVPTERRDVEIHYPHKQPLLISPVAFEPGQPKLARSSDWAIDISMARGDDDMRATIAHGSPYAYVRLTRGDVRITLPAAGERDTRHPDARVLALRVGQQRFALFGPTGGRWEQVSPTQWIGHLPAGKGYLSAAALPDDKPDTLQLLARHAYAFVTDTQVNWQYDRPNSRVSTHYTATTQVMEGSEKAALLGLYPHHWHGNASVSAALGPRFDTIRGPLRLLPSSTFQTTATYSSFVPYWPAIADPARTQELKDLSKTDLRNARRMMLEIGNGPYWQGKGLQRIVKLMDVAEQQGDLAARDQLLEMLKKRIETWFSGESSKTYFHLDRTLGTVVAYPEEYFSVQQMNDHHFHYGYWIRAMAEIALRDPAWAASSRWGGMVDLLVADIATHQRGRADFPFLRNFDVYEGHSWASGVGLGPFGNNQESSSEAVNAWTGLILWGELTGNTALRDLGVWLFTTEIESIQHYWFDVHKQVLPPEYQSAEVSMVFGSKIAHNTWWTDEPRQIKGINLLPMTTASTYMARSPEFITRSLATLPAETEIFRSRGKRADPVDIWQDIFAKYLALADPARALKQWDRWGSVELGDTRSHALHWLQSLNEMGVPDPSVTADTVLYSVFKRADGKRTYLAFNPGATPASVRFSDGRTLSVAPSSLGRLSD